MGKRYFCEFCDKTIPDNISNRKKHCEGAQHQSLRKEYYSKFKDLGTILSEERDKQPCSKFLNGKHCIFGLNCRFSHKTPSQLQYLEDLYRLECHNKVKKYDDLSIKGKKSTSRPTSIIELSQLSREELEQLEKYLPNYELSTHLSKKKRYLLPPSLLPPTRYDFINCNLNTWG